MTNTYETIFICPGDITQEKVEAALDKVKAIISREDGKVKTAELWGRRKLAFAINKNRDGFYAYVLFTGSAKTPSLLETHYRVTDNILRGLTVKIDPRYVDKVRSIVQSAAPEAEAGGTVVATKAVSEAVSAEAESATVEATPAASPEN